MVLEEYVSNICHLKIFCHIFTESFYYRKKQREIDQKEAAKRRLQLQRKAAAKNSIIYRILPQMLWSRRAAVATTAFSIVIGICAYYYKAQLVSVTNGFS